MSMPIDQPTGPDPRDEPDYLCAECGEDVAMPGARICRDCATHHRYQMSDDDQG